MKGALVIDYTRPHAGREALALASFEDGLTFFEKLAADDKIDEPMVFMGSSGRGFMIAVGEREVLLEITQSEEFFRLMFRAGLAVPDVRFELMMFGEEVRAQMRLWGEVARELEFV